MEVELLIFGILGRQNAFFYVVGNGVDDSFSVENRARMEFIGTGRWKEILRLRKMGRGQFLSVMGGEGKCFLLLLFGHSTPYIYNSNILP